MPTAGQLGWQIELEAGGPGSRRAWKQECLEAEESGGRRAWRQESLEAREHGGVTARKQKIFQGRNAYSRTTWDTETWTPGPGDRRAWKPNTLEAGEPDNRSTFQESLGADHIETK